MSLSAGGPRLVVGIFPDREAPLRLATHLKPPQPPSFRGAGGAGFGLAAGFAAVAKGLFIEDDVDVIVTLARQVGGALRSADAVRPAGPARHRRELAEVLRDVVE